MNRNEPTFLAETFNLQGARPGVIYLANESRFSAATLSEPLTEFAGGLSDPEGLKSILDFVAPEVVAARAFEYAKAAADAPVPAESDDVRAIGADFKRVDRSMPHEFGNTLNKGLTIRIDRQASPGTPQIENAFVAWLVARLYRNDFKRAVALLDSAAVSSGVTWDPEGEADPDEDVADALIAAETASGLAPNRLLYGQSAFRLRAKTLRGRDHAGQAATAGASLETLAPILGVDEIRVSGHRLQGATIDRIVPSAAYGFFAQPQATLEDASNIKRFVTPFNDGGLLRVHRFEVNASFVDLTVEHYSDVVLTSEAGITKLAVS